MTNEFFMSMIPPTVTHQEKKIGVNRKTGKPYTYEPGELKEARQKLLDHLAAHVQSKKYTKGIRLITRWCFPCGDTHGDGEYRITKPDTDNLQKLLKDCMTAVGFWKDDALVASELCEKFWARIPGIYIRIEEVGNAD